MKNIIIFCLLILIGVGSDHLAWAEWVTVTREEGEQIEVQDRVIKRFGTYSPMFENSDASLKKEVFLVPSKLDMPTFQKVVAFTEVALDHPDWSVQTVLAKANLGQLNSQADYEGWIELLNYLNSPDLDLFIRAYAEYVKIHAVKNTSLPVEMVASVANVLSDDLHQLRKRKVLSEFRNSTRQIPTAPIKAYTFHQNPKRNPVFLFVSDYRGSGSIDFLKVVRSVNHVQIIKPDIFNGDNPEVSTIALHHSTGILALGKLDGEIAFINTKGGYIPQSIQSKNSLPIRKVAFHFNQRLFAYATDEEIVEYDVPTRGMRSENPRRVISRAFPTHGVQVREIKWNDEGDLILVGEKDSKKVAYNVQKNELSKLSSSDPFELYFDENFRRGKEFAFSPHGNFLYIIHRDEGRVTALPWNWKVEELIERVKNASSLLEANLNYKEASKAI